VIFRNIQTSRRRPSPNIVRPNGMVASSLYPRSAAAFKCLADQGWSYLAALHVGQPPIRHIFQTSPPDMDSHFFSVILSPSKEEISVVDCSPDMARAISRQVRNLYTPNVIREGWKTTDAYTLQIMRRDFLRRHEDVALLIAQLLKAAAERGYKLDATIPLGRTIFGLGRRREVWMFRKITGFVE